MKNLKSYQIVKKSMLFFSAAVFLSACSTNQLNIQIPAKQSVVLDYPNYEAFSANLKNTSFSQVDVAVKSKNTSKQIRGFGLGPMGKAKVMVEKENELVLTNPSKKNIKLNIIIMQESTEVAPKEGVYRKFTLENKSAKSIPLLIPNVMNPNLSPNSQSGVDLKIGQEILFRYKGQRHLLLKVDESVQNGDVIDVAQLLEQKKNALKNKG